MSTKAGQFCHLCPDGADGYWATGHEAWFRCWSAGHCMRETGGRGQRSAWRFLACPKCGAPAGEPCTSMTGKLPDKRPGRRIASPHRARVAQTSPGSSGRRGRADELALPGSSGDGHDVASGGATNPQPRVYSEPST